MKNIAITLLTTLSLSLFSSCGNKEKEEAVEMSSKPLSIDKIVALGRVEPEAKITSVGSEVSGIVKSVLHQAGDTVKKGDVIIEIAAEYENAKLSSSQAGLATQQADIKSDVVQLESARIKVANLQDRYARLSRVVAAGADTRQNLDNLKADLDEAQKEVSRIETVINTAKIRLAESQADIRMSSVDIERRKIKAPADGVILTMDITPGSAINAQSLFEFAPLSPLTVLGEVDELFANSIKIGQKAIIRNPGMEAVLAKGEVISAGPFLKKNRSLAKIVAIWKTDV